MIRIVQAIDTLKKEKLKWSITLFLLLYSFSMVIYPLFINFSFSYLMDSWFKWQSFNVGVFALASSVVFYLGVKKREDIHRKSHYLANAAIITHEFMLLNKYLRDNIQWLDHQWNYIENGANNTASTITKPKAGDTYLENFKNCMFYSESEERGYLSSLLFKMQILKSRMDVTESNITGKEFDTAKFRIIKCIYDTTEIYSHILANYNYFRQLEPFNSNVFGIEIVDQAITQLELQSDKYEHQKLSLLYLREKYANKGESHLLSKV